MKGIAVLVVILVAVIAGVVRPLPERLGDQVGRRSGPRQFPQGDEAGGGLPQAQRSRNPTFGVYRYSTKGAEEIESTAASTGHDYGALTAITVTPTRCGVKERWLPLVQSWTEGEVCLKPKSSRVVSVRTFHEFFGESKLVRYGCRGGSTPYSAELRPGAHWVTTCKSDSGTVVSHVEVGGVGKVKIGARPIAAIHLHSSVKLSGDPDGTDTQETWLRRSNGLLLRRVNNSKAHVSAGGGSEFSEHYEIRLISTKPQR